MRIRNAFLHRAGKFIANGHNEYSVGGTELLVRRRKNQLDAVKLKFIDFIHSACFRHHYAHHQKYSKGRQTAYGVQHWSCGVDLRS
jgi:hypothetical protein